MTTETGGVVPKPDGYLARQDLHTERAYSKALEKAMKHLVWLLGEALPFVPEDDSLRDQIVHVIDGDPS